MNDTRKGFYVPKWVAAATAVVVVGGIGFGAGQVTASDSSGAAATSAQSPFANGRFGPFSGRQGTGSTSGGTGSGSTSGGSGSGSTSGGTGSGSTSGGSGSQTAPSNTGQAFLGVSVQDAPNAAGATIADVASGSPAATAGLQTADVVTAVGGTPITSASDLGTAVHAHQPGDVVTVTYQRNGTTATVQVTLGSAAAASTTPSN